MKTKLFVGLIVFLSVTLKSYNQFSFGVSPGIGLNSAYLGYKVNTGIMPYLGFQFLNAKFKIEESGQEYDWDLNQVVSYSDKNVFSGSLYIPNLGVKYFIKQQNKIMAYVTLNLSKPFISGKIKYEGEEDEDFKETIKKIGIWGGEFGFGVEYFFDENFSLGGEFGLRYLHIKYNDTYDDEFYNPIIDDYQESETEYDYKYNMSPTFSKISLNFYF